MPNCRPSSRRRVDLMLANRLNARRGWALALGLVLASTGFGAEESDLPEDTQGFFEFLGSPEAESELWNTILDSVPDQPGEKSPVSVEAQATMGVDK
jgi:hypothetical protein